jgi:hypothetical protein
MDDLGMRGLTKAHDELTARSQFARGSTWGACLGVVIGAIVHVIGGPLWVAVAVSVSSVMLILIVQRCWGSKPAVEERRKDGQEELVN